MIFNFLTLDYGSVTSFLFSCLIYVAGRGHYLPKKEKSTSSNSFIIHNKSCKVLRQHNFDRIRGSHNEALFYTNLLRCNLFKQDSDQNCIE